MKRIKLLPSVLMLVLCVGILAIGVYAASPITGTINGTINITAAQGVKIAVYRGTSTAAVDLIDSAFGSSEVELAAGGATLDASSATSPEEVADQIYTVVLSTNQSTNYIVDTETIQVVDGVGVTTGEKVSGAAIITKLHKPYVANDTVTTDTNGNACFTKDKPYTIQISIKCGKVSTEAISVSYNIDMAIYTESEYTGTGVNGVDYLYFGEYPQTLAATSLDGYTKLQDANSGYVTFAAYDDATGGKTTRDVYTDGTANYVAIDSNLYKIEPLKWNILERDKTTGRAKLMCDTIVEQVKFQYNYASGDGTYYAKDYAGNFVLDGSGNKVKANNYEYSLLRSFMNDTFYNSAFNASEKAVMLKEVVDNTITTETGTSANANACADTEDWIFAPSYQEVVGSYGFSSNSGYSATRILYPSDYGKDTGVHVAYETEEARDTSFDDSIDYAYEDYGITFTKDRAGRIAYLMDSAAGWGISDEQTANEIYDAIVGSGYWWLRSPDSSYAYYARSVDLNGSVYYNYVNVINPGCVPALLLGL